MAKRKKTSTTLDGDDYRKGALERLADAWVLYRAGQFAGCVSDAGRAVEGMLRAVIWKRDADVAAGKKSLDTGHDLRELLTRVADLGLLAEDPARDELRNTIQHVAQLWFNNVRFASTKFVETLWLGRGEVNPKRTIKQAAEQFWYDCQEVVKRCEVLCQRQN
jgi:HEPN domain-containing protein